MTRTRMLVLMFRDRQFTERMPFFCGVGLFLQCSLRILVCRGVERLNSGPPGRLLFAGAIALFLRGLGC
jgi:hypothetical protein